MHFSDVELVHNFNPTKLKSLKIMKMSIALHPPFRKSVSWTSLNCTENKGNFSKCVFLLSNV